MTATPRARLGEIGAATVGFAWFLWLGGTDILDPSDVRWVNGGDHAVNWLGWQFFRNAPWSLPLGSIPNLLYPVGTSVSMTDSIPWLALPFRIFSGLLPLDFQYFGLWLGAAFILQGFFGAKLTSIATEDPLVQGLGGALFAVTPVLVFRLGHLALCAHWLIIALLWLNLRRYDDPAQMKRALFGALAINVFGAGVQPYLELMLLTLGIALVVRLSLVDRKLPWAWLVGGLLGLVLAVAGVFKVLGYLVPGIGSAGGFGYFASDLSALVNPMGYSRFFAGQPIGGGAYEGYAYLGAGPLALLVIGVGLMALRGPKSWSGAKVALPVLVAAVLLFAFACSNEIRYHGQLVTDLKSLYAPVMGIAASLRSSGRFVWSLHYLVLGVAILAIVKAFERFKWVPRGLLLLAVAAQVIELPPSLGRDQIKPKGNVVALSPGWFLAQNVYRHLVLYPPLIFQYCGPWNLALQNRTCRLSHIAYQLKMTMNSGVAGRVDPVKMSEACAATHNEVATGRLDPSTLYAVFPEHLAHFQAAGAVCGVLDQELVCVVPDAGGHFARFLAAQPR